jgi:hypothetical protein
MDKAEIFKATDIWQTTSLDCLVAQELFGWKWLAYQGTPVKGTPGYPKHQTIRRFFPPDIMQQEAWHKHFQKLGGVSDASGNEPLDYSYCSSNGPHDVPHFSGHESAVRQMETELLRRGLLKRYQESIAEVTDEELPSCEDRCIAALIAIGSKYVTRD